jgi:hypothetical protein
MKTRVLGIYIFSPARGWYCGGGLRGGAARWGKFEDAKEWSEGQECEAEDVREKVGGNDATYTLALLQ